MEILSAHGNARSIVSRGSHTRGIVVDDQLGINVLFFCVALFSVMVVVMEARHPRPVDFANERIWIVAENFSSQPEVDRSGRKVSAIPKKLAMLCENTD